MLRHRTAEILHRTKTPLLNFLRWAIQDSIGRITVLGFLVVASFIIQLNDLEFDYGLQRILHLLAIGGPFLMLIFCLTSREMWVKLPTSVSFIFVFFIVLMLGIIPVFIQIWPIIVPLILILIFRLRKDLVNNSLLRAGYILSGTILSSILILLILLATTFGSFPATLVKRTYNDYQSIISVYEYDEISLAPGDGDRTCRQRIEQRQIFPGILAKRGELNKECGDKESDYSADFRSKP
jgi:hypothetical protein